MKKIAFFIVICALALSLNAEAWRFKAGLNTYSPSLSEYSSSHSLYRLNARMDLFNLSSRLGAGTNMSISVKSDNHDVDYYNNYDFYIHNFYGDDSKEETYIVYGILLGMRYNKVKTSSPDYHDKVVSNNSSFLLGVLLSRNDWGTEIMLSQNQQNDWKFDFSTKYNFIGKYYIEISYCKVGPIPEIDEDFSITFGMEFFNSTED